MIGYCQAVKKNVEMEDIETIQLPDLSFIHKGYFRQGRKKHVIWKKVQDENLIVTPAGHRIPDIVYASRKTPKRLYTEIVGQRVVSRETNIPNIDPDKKIKKKTVDEFKRKVANEKKVSIHSLRD